MLRAFTPDEMRAFFEALGQSFDHPAELVVVGGAGAILRHGATRPTVDIDMYSVPPPDGFVDAVVKARQRTNLVIPIEYPAVAQTPCDYDTRLERVFDMNLGQLTVLVPERHDLALMKIMRSDERDLLVISQMHQVNPLDLDTFVTRYTDEMSHAVADHRILRHKFLVCVERLFGPHAVDATRERIERAPVERELAPATAVRDGKHLHRYGIRPETIALDRFSGTVLQTHDGAMVFPFGDTVGVTGLLYEGRGEVQSSGRLDRGVWSSRARENDRALILTIDPLDALAYAQANRASDVRYLATGPTITPATEKLVVGAIEAMPRDGRTVLAFPGNDLGNNLATQVQRLTSRKTEIHLPLVGGSWSAFLGDSEP